MFSFTVFTLTRPLIQEDIFSALLPGNDGDFELFQGHAPMIHLLRPGRVIVKRLQNSFSQLYLFVGGGICVFDGIKASIISPHAVSLEDEKEETLANALANFRHQGLGYSPLKI
jgi:F0F1-type ATP synthase epsilon subunit